MLEKIKQIEDRYEEINQLLENPEISKDHIKVRDLIKEQTKIKSIDKQMHVQRGNRGKLIRVAIVGYTNVG